MKFDVKRIKDAGINLVPALTIMHGAVVKREGKKCIPVLDDKDEPVSLMEIISQLKDDFNIFLVVDINGITRDEPQLDMLKEASASKAELWVDTGVAYGKGIIDVLVAGAASVVMSTKTLKSIEELKKALELSENVIAGIDYERGIVSPNDTIKNMQPREFLELVANYGIKRAILTDIEALGSNSSLNMDVARTLANLDVELFSYGNFDESDLYSLQKEGIINFIVDVEKLIEIEEG